ncbi:MAG: cache domain-containing protein, partial [Terricaulis sp.]
ADNAARAVRSELAANGEVFDRVWTMRDAQLRDSADILSRDFGFREAVATMDAPTIGSALDNLRDRLQIDRAFMMTLDGDVVGGSAFAASELDAMWAALDGDEQASGVLMLDGQAYQAVSAPIRAPNLVGWIVFASELNAAHLDSFEELSAIPLNASVFTRTADDGWASTDVELGMRDLTRIGAELNQGPAQIDAAPRRWQLQHGAVVAVTRPLRAFDGAGANVLVLTYPLALALRPYEPVLASIILVGLLGIGLLIFGSWVLARGLTRPIAALDDAAHALQRGERVHVAIETSDEIGRLALSFNNMSNEIDERQRRITHMALHRDVRNPTVRNNPRRCGLCAHGGTCALLRRKIVRDRR